MTEKETVTHVDVNVTIEPDNKPTGSGAYILAIIIGIILALMVHSATYQSGM